MVLIIFLYIYIDLLLNCIEITTPRSLSRFRFISRRPSTTPRSKTTTKLPEIKNSDQTIESSNQQSLEENANDGDTTELGILRPPFMIYSKLQYQKNQRYNISLF